MKRVVTFGEIMLRLNPKGQLLLFQTDELIGSFAGSEANVAVSIANYGIPASFVSKIPDHVIGSAAIGELRRFGVDVTYVLRGGQRLGIYFVEKGASQRPSKVVYDRSGSAISEARRDEFDWEEILSDAQWFHFSGITPALSRETALICRDACQNAKKRGIKISIDLNYRSKLWSREEATAAMGELATYADLIIGNEADASDVFGINVKNTDLISGSICKEGYVEAAEMIASRFGCDQVAFTLRGSHSATINDWGAMLYEKGKYWFSPTYSIQLVDRIGGGDSFAGALIFALISDFRAQYAINFATAASCLKQTIENDFNRVTLSDIEILMKGDDSGRVQR